MAEALSGAGIGHNLSRASFLEFCTEFDQIERELQDAQETVRSIRKRRKDYRKDMAANGVDIDMFDRMLADSELTAEERRARDFEYRRYMEWQSKPVGFQPSIDLQSDDPAERAMNVHELHAIDGEGYDAGRGGLRRDGNPWRPGTEPHQRWDNAWMRGQASLVGEMGQPNGHAGNGHADRVQDSEAAAPKRRGRPFGSKNRPKEAAAENGNGGAPKPPADDDPAETPPAEEDPPADPPPPPNPNPEPEPPPAA